jgi:hypothetical protein
MKARLFIAAAMIFGVLAFGGQISAHHGKAAYDETIVTSIKGTVSAFEFVNPHAQITFEVKTDKGNVQEWIGQGTSPNLLAREGWNRKTIKPGDQITATGHPARNRTNLIRIEKIVLPDGRELTFEGPGGT